MSSFLSVLMEELGYERVRSGGAGNKMLLLLEERGDAYIQDRGLSRWDTCGAQAILEAHGGMLEKLSTFVGDAGASGNASYTYLLSENNADFIPGLSKVTPYNCRRKENAPGKSDPVVKSDDVAIYAPYSNLCGLVALAPRTNASATSLEMVRESCLRAKERQAPAYD